MLYPPDPLLPHSRTQAMKRMLIAKSDERKAVKKYTDAERHDASNRIAAEAILENPVKHEGALLLWAKAFLARVKQ
jgi:hypothetical protein